MRHPDIEALLRIDALDAKIIRLRREIEDVPGELEKHRRALADAKAKLDLCHDEQKRTQAEIHKLALEVKSNEDQATKYQVQQNTAKTNEEYATLRRQIEAIKKANGDLEDRQLALYEKQDKLKEAEKGAKAGVKIAEEKLGQEAAELKREEDSLRADLAKLEAERAREEKGVGQGAMAQYKRVLDKLGGKRAMAQVLGRTCQGCFIEISPNSVSMLLSGKEVVTCPQCARILYLERDYRAVTSISYTVGEKDRDSTSKDGNW